MQIKAKLSPAGAIGLSLAMVLSRSMIIERIYCQTQDSLLHAVPANIVGTHSAINFVGIQ